ncbi:MAG: glycosyltransferase [Eubacterium sp.]|nr:glycosyltransferase [Eubacterium sp.]
MKTKIIEINAANYFSTGTIMLSIAEKAREKGYEVTTFSKNTRTAQRVQVKEHQLIGTVLENTLHRYFSWITDFQDCGSYFGTKKLIREIEKISPDIIHLHDVVGWYINIGVFFRYLKKKNIPVVWTFHCCWAYTGRCIYYDFAKCDKWMSECHKCPQPEAYPMTKLLDHSRWNFRRKKKLFTDLEKLTIVTPSLWLKKEVEKSFLKEKECIVINNGINKEIFQPRESDFRQKHQLQNKKIILGVSAYWTQPRKGLRFLNELAEGIGEDYKVVVVGVRDNEDIELSEKILALPPTSNPTQLAEIYTAADVFVNPTLEDNFPTTNIEALSCGTPVVTFKTGGSVEVVTENTGRVVDQEDVEGLKNAIYEMTCSGKDYKEFCLKKSEDYDKEHKFEEYVELYERLIKDENE